MFLRLDRKGPIYSQIYRALRAQILAGRLSPGFRVPSTRSLSAELGVSRTIAVLAYEQLLSEGYLATRAGAGTFVAPELPENLTMVTRSGPVICERGDPIAPRLSSYAARIAAEQFTLDGPRSTPPYDFRYGRPSFADFPHATWSRLMTRRLRPPRHANSATGRLKVRRRCVRRSRHICIGHEPSRAIPIRS